MIQDTISNYFEIIERLKLELENAQSEILVAMAWFTDYNLLDILLKKAVSGVNISVIVADNEENNKLDFESIDSLHNAEVFKVKNVGWGLMNHKFCIIDRKVVVTGSFNWTRNAKNNHGNILVTNIEKTITEFSEIFFNIKENAIKIMNGIPITDPDNSNPGIINANNNLSRIIPVRKLSFQEQSLVEFKDVLDNIIATEVGALDKDYIRISAYNRAKENNGDHQILPQAMDSLYSNFINEIEVVADKKTRLKGKIEEQLKLSLSNIELKTENEINTKKENFVQEEKNIREDILSKEKEIEKSKSTIESNVDTQIPFLQAQIEKLRQKINEQKIEFVKPPIDWPKSIVLCILLVLLIGYIFVFYSSVAYIFMFAKEDIMEALRSGNMVTEMPEVFNANAISNINNKGMGGILFLGLFVVIPLALGMFQFLNETALGVKDDSTSILGKFINKFGGIILIFVVDIFIAYKVAVNINEVEFLTRVVDKRLNIWEIVSSGNFWLVFVLGTLGVFLFSKVFHKLMNSLNRRNQTYQQEVVKQVILNFESDIEKLESDIKEIYSKNNELKSSLLVLNVDLSNLKEKFQLLPIQHTEQLNDLRQLLNSFKEKIINLSNIYKSQIDNDKLPISKSEMENRCNIFMEGWSKYLYEFYAVLLAENKTKDAIHEIENWLKSLQWQADTSSELKFDSITINN